MKKLIACVLILYVAIVAGRIAHDVLVAQGTPPPPSENGDVNGDGDRDISDGIYLLTWLFAGGPEPVALAGSPELEGRVGDLEAAVAALQASAGGVAAALESVALLLGDISIADAVPRSAFQPIEGSRTLVLLLGELVTEPIGAHLSEEVSGIPVMHVAFRVEAPVVDTDALLGATALLGFHQLDHTRDFGGEVIAAAHAGRQGSGSIIRISIAPKVERLARTRRSRTFERMSNMDVVRRVFADHAIGHAVTGTLPTIRHEFIVQYQESDLDFVNRLLEEDGLHYFFDGSTGAGVRISSDSTAAPEIEGTFAYLDHQATPPSPGEAYVHTFHAAVRPVAGTVQVSGWNYVAKQRFTQTETTGSGGALEDFFLGEADGVEVQSDARGRRDLAIAGGRPVAGTSTIPTLRPGWVVTIRGVGGSFDGKYFVTSVRHTIARNPAGGKSSYLYGNAFTCIPAAVPFRPERSTARPKIYGTEPAIVTDNKDPDSLGRVKVKFPWLPDSTGDASVWVRVASFGAGKDRGFYSLPEVEDEVLVAFTHGDPSHPVVLGSVWNGKDKPPSEGSDGKNDSRLFKSRSGHTLHFDDTEGKEKISIRAAKHLVDEMSTIGLEAESTRVAGVLASSSNAGPGTPVEPGERHRDNAIVAWARIAASGDVVGEASFGVEQVRRVRPGVYTVILGGSAHSVAELIPVATADVAEPPSTQQDLRVASVEQIDTESFAVYINSGLGFPVDAGFVILVTAR